MMRRALLALILLFAPAAFAAPPDWLRELAKAPLPAYPADTKGVALLDETVVTVTGSGDVRTFRRCAYKILGTEGRDLGYVAVHFDSETKLRDLRAWAITAAGVEMQVKERDAVETASFDGELYSDSKMKVLRIPGAEPGNVVAFEYEQQGRPYGLQSVWMFQSAVPVRRARYTLTLPAGWSHEARWFHAGEVAPKRAGEQLVWELADVPALPEEAGMPATGAVAAQLAVRFLPPDGVLTSRVHRTWSDVARWYHMLASPRVAPSPAMQTKTRELLNGKTSLVEKIGALAKFAQQDIRYVAIAIGIGSHQPHAAGDVFANRYGDCKDKVTLLAAMLREAGIDSHFVLVNTDRGIAPKDFPSHAWFNHAIIAIRIPEEAAKGMHATVKHPKLGRLLLFDPTSSVTPLGHLPPYLQDNAGLLVSSDGGEMVDFAPHAPDASRLARTAKLTLGADGTLAGDVRETRSGAMAANLRARLQGLTPIEQQRYIESTASYHLNSIVIRDLAIENLDELSKELVVRYTITASRYAKNAGGMLLVRPRVLGSKADGIIDLKERKHDYVMDGPAVHVDEVEIAVPAGLVADELPEVRSVTTPAVTYTSSTAFEQSTLKYRREYKVHGFQVPLPKLADLNKAFTQILADERTSAVLVRK